MSANTPHSALSIPELVQEVLTHLLGHSSSSDSQDIDAASLVCKLWKVLAFDLKWRATNFDDLLSVLVPMKTQIKKEWKWECSPQPKDWERFRQAAHRVVTLKNVFLSRFGPELLEVMRTRDDSESSLVPNVQAVEVHLHDPQHFAHTLLLLPMDPLKRLEIIIPTFSSSNSTGQLNVIAIIPSRYPHLSHLCLSGFGDDLELREALGGMLSRLTTLRSVKLYSQALSPTILSALGNLELLEVMKLGKQCTQEIPQTEQGDFTHARGVFPSLVEVDVRCGSYGAIASLLANMAAARYSVKRLTFRHTKSLPRLANLSVVLHAVSLHASLRELALSAYCVEVLEAGAMQLLGACQELVSLSLVVSASKIQVTKEDIDALAARHHPV
ncbi:hypothetical protein FRB96_000682 [Tulasnella sp. 330]|nr:hypothetical protein FRB96_000682 [Tulasnella sp. 330]KAG8879788.1 hypothetical protein FRB97_001394 [Tulasnella sp. 331]